MTITLSEELLDQLRMTPEEMRIEFAVWLYAQERASFGQAKTLAGLTHLGFQAALADRHIPLNLDIQDLHDDMKTLGMNGGTASGRSGKGSSIANSARSGRS